jgi:hypothetical protein
MSRAMQTIDQSATTGSSSSSAEKASFFEKAGSLIDTLGVAITKHYESEADKNFVASLNTPQKKQWNQELFELRMVELKEKRRKFEAGIDSGVPANVAATANDSSTVSPIDPHAHDAREGK